MDRSRAAWLAGKIASLCASTLMAVWLWRVHAETVAVVPDIYELEGMKVGVVFFFVLVVLVSAASLHFNLRRFSLWSIPSLAVTSCVVYLYAKFAMHVSELVGGIL